MLVRWGQLMPTFKPRDAMCVECPYRPENKKHLNEQQMGNIVQHNAVFPCHMEMKGVVGSPSYGVEEYVKKVDVFVICKGRFEEMKRENDKR